MIFQLTAGFAIGTILGSFILAVSNRLIQDRSVLGRSSCDSCHKSLNWFDLIPLVSFLVLGMKCRFCRQKIARETLVSEIVMGILVALIILTSGSVPLEIIFKILATVVLGIVFITDLKSGYIFDVVTYPAVILGIVWLILLSPNLIGTAVLSGLGAAFFFAFLIFITRGRGMGWGDVKYAVFLGLVLNFPNIVLGLFLAFLIGALFSIGLIILHKKSFKATIAFGPFLSVGSYLVLISGDKIWQFYLTYLTHY